MRGTVNCLHKREWIAQAEWILTSDESEFMRDNYYPKYEEKKRSVDKLNRFYTVTEYTKRYAIVVCIKGILHCISNCPSLDMLIIYSLIEESYFIITSRKQCPLLKKRAIWQAGHI